MSVVEKIEKLPEVSFDIFREATKVTFHDDSFNGLFKKTIWNPDSKIDHVYKAALEAIEFYNTLSGDKTGKE